MPLYKDNTGKIHDDMGGAALLLPSWAKNCVQITDEEAAAIQNPHLTLDKIKAKKLANLAAYRYTKETAGITVNGWIVRTDRDSRTIFHQAWSEGQVNPKVSIDWKGANGWATIGKAEIDAIKQIMFKYVQDCFTNERRHEDGLELIVSDIQKTDMQKIAEIEAYDITTGWPEDDNEN